MILETTRIFSEWLGNATYGVNSKLALLTIDEGDDPLPLIEKVLDPTKDDSASGSEPDWPVLIVSIDEPALIEVGEVSQGILDAEVIVTIRIATAEKETARAAQRTLSILRAVHQSISDLFDQGNAVAVAARLDRNGIDLLFTPRREWGEVAQEFEGGRIAGVYMVTVRVRDTETNG